MPWAAMLRLPFVAWAFANERAPSVVIPMDCPTSDVDPLAAMSFETVTAPLVAVKLVSPTTAIFCTAIPFVAAMLRLPPLVRAVPTDVVPVAIMSIVVVASRVVAVALTAFTCIDELLVVAPRLAFRPAVAFTDEAARAVTSILFVALSTVVPTVAEPNVIFAAIMLSGPPFAFAIFAVEPAVTLIASTPFRPLDVALPAVAVRETVLPATKFPVVMSLLAVSNTLPVALAVPPAILPFDAVKLMSSVATKFEKPILSAVIIMACVPDVEPSVALPPAIKLTF